MGVLRGIKISSWKQQGLMVNRAPQRSSLLEHLCDVQNHRCLVSGDSLPMHFALGTGTRCVSLFTCTSPWEIYDYGIQKKIVSPLLEEFFYKRGYDERSDDRYKCRRGLRRGNGATGRHCVTVADQECRAAVGDRS